MVVLEAMDLAARPIGHPAVHEPHRRQEGQPHGRCRRGSRAFLTGDGPVMIAEIEAALLLEHRLPQYPHDRPPRHRRHPRRVLQPHRADGRGSLAPAPARCHRARVLLRRLAPLGLRTPLWPSRGGPDGPPVRVLVRDQGLWGPNQALADLDRGGLRLRRTASTRPLCGGTDRVHLRGERRRAPEARRAAPPSLPPACRGGDGRLSVGRPGKPAGCNTLAGLGDVLGLWGWGGALGRGRWRGQLAGVHDEKPACFYSQAPSGVVHCPLADDPGPVPASRRLLACTARLCESPGQRGLLRAPRLHLLAHRTRARDQRAPPSVLLQAPPQRALTGGLTVGHHAVHPVEPARHTLREGPGGLWAVPGMARAQAHAEREASTAPAETPAHLLEIVMAVVAMPRGGSGGAQPCPRAGRRLIGPLPGDRGRIRMEPGGRAGIPRKGVEGDGTKHAVEMGGTPRLEHLSEAVIVP